MTPGDFDVSEPTRGERDSIGLLRAWAAMDVKLTERFTLFRDEVREIVARLDSLTTERDALQRILTHGHTNPDVATLRNVWEQQRRVVDAACLWVACDDDDAWGAAQHDVIHAVKHLQRMTGEGEGRRDGGRGDG